MADAAGVLPGQLDVDAVLELVVRDQRRPATAAVSGELVAPADELVEAFAATLVARPQTHVPTSGRVGASRVGSGRSPALRT